MLWTIVVFLISFLFGFAVSYYGIKDDLRKSKNLKELKIRYGVWDEDGE